MGNGNGRQSLTEAQGLQLQYNTTSRPLAT